MVWYGIINAKGKGKGKGKGRMNLTQPPYLFL
jgi:hypothetical protein